MPRYDADATATVPVTAAAGHAAKTNSNDVVIVVVISLVVVGCHQQHQKCEWCRQHNCRKQEIISIIYAHVIDNTNNIVNVVFQQFVSLLQRQRQQRES